MTVRALRASSLARMRKKNKNIARGLTALGMQLSSLFVAAIEITSERATIKINGKALGRSGLSFLFLISKKPIAQALDGSRFGLVDVDRGFVPINFPRAHGNVCANFMFTNKPG